MNRRSILKSLGILPLGFITAKAKKGIRFGDTIYSSYKNYKGFDYFWRAWIQTPDSLKIVGQWIAINTKKNINIYSSYPGYSGQFKKGAVFNITTQSHQHFMQVNCKEKIKEKVKQEALETLFKEIDRYYEELKNPPQKEKYGFGFSGFQYKN